MPERIYLDTNAYRYLGIAFENATLPADLRDRMLHSPLSAFEVMKQLADEDGDAVLRQIHAIRNWTNPQHAGLLPAPDDMLRCLWFGKSIMDDDFTKKMQHSFNVCLTTNSVTDIKAEAAKHKEFMVSLKLKAAQDFQAMIVDAKKYPFDITKAWFLGIAHMVDADPNSKSIDEVVKILSAYHEYEQSKLQTALEIPEYNPLSLKNQNDIIDAEQLVYLGDASLCFLTCDQGFRKRVKESEQAARIITVAPEELLDAQNAEALLGNITSPK
jgi:hypothetical protein